MYNQHTRGMETTKHRSLVERGGRKALLETLLTHTHAQKKNVQKKPIFTNLKKRFEHIELPAKLLDYFLQSNKSNINQRYFTGARAASSSVVKTLFVKVHRHSGDPLHEEADRLAAAGTDKESGPRDGSV